MPLAVRPVATRSSLLAATERSFDSAGRCLSNVSIEWATTCEPLVVGGLGGPRRIRTSVGVRRQVYSLLPLATRASTHRPGRRDSEGMVAAPLRLPTPQRDRSAAARGTLARMPSFDVVSEVDRQEVRNAVDQAQREIATRFDFKNTNSSIEQNELAITMHTVSEDRLNALRTVLEEKLVKRGVSLRGVDYGDVQEASGGTVRQVATISVGISSDKAKQINKLIKEKGAKGVSSQTQGESIRVSAKKRDHLQDVISMLESRRRRHPAAVQQLPRLIRHAAANGPATSRRARPAPWSPPQRSLRRWRSSPSPPVALRAPPRRPPPGSAPPPRAAGHRRSSRR